MRWSLPILAIATVLAATPTDADARRPRARAAAPAAPRPPRPPAHVHAPEAPEPPAPPDAPLPPPPAMPPEPAMPPQPPAPPSFALVAPPAPTGPGVTSFWFTSGRGRLGVGVSSMSEELRKFFGASANAGLLVQNVQPDTLAQRAGVAVGDVIVAVDGDPVADVGDVARALHDRGAGDKVEIEVVRAKKSRRLVGELREADGGARMESMPPQVFELFGDMDGRGDDVEKRLDALNERLERLERRLGGTAPRRRPEPTKRAPKKPARPPADHT